MSVITFVGGTTGDWRVERVQAVCGEGLPATACVSTHTKPVLLPDAGWLLRGAISNLRYANKAEVTTLKSVQEGLGRPAATCAALIPIKKSAAWWDLAQDERRAIFEETSHHTAIGLDYLPAIARRLHHCRDLSNEPFDFLTWFEFAPEHGKDFDAMLQRLRATHEWTFVEREVDIRLVRGA